MRPATLADTAEGLDPVVLLCTIEDETVTAPRHYRVRGRACGAVGRCSYENEETPWNALGDMDDGERCYDDTELPSVRCRCRRREPIADVCHAVSESLREDDMFNRNRKAWSDLKDPDSIMTPFGDIMHDDDALMRFNDTTAKMYALGKMIRKVAPIRYLSKETFSRWKEALETLDDDTPLRTFL